LIDTPGFGDPDEDSFDLLEKIQTGLNGYKIDMVAIVLKSLDYRKSLAAE